MGPGDEALRELFLLDPTVVFLNHGSFGACPRPVFEEYQRWQRELERQPVEFLGRRANGLLDAARARLADYLHVGIDDLVFVPNATSGLNVVARSLPLEAGDEVLTTDHEYGALDRTWQHVCAKAGARYVRQPIPLPVTTPEAIVEAVWRGVTPRTKRPLPQPHHLADRADLSGRGDLPPGARGRHRLGRRRRPCAGADPARSDRARRRRLLRQLPQVALRAEGVGVPLRAAGAPGLGRVADRQLGLGRGQRPVPAGERLRQPQPVAGHPRRRRLPGRAGRDRLPG